MWGSARCAVLGIGAPPLTRTSLTCIGLAAGLDKVPGIPAGARAGSFDQLVTDAETAAALLSAPS